MVIDAVLGAIVAFGGAVGFGAPPQALRFPIVVLVWFGGMIGRAAWRLRASPWTLGSVLAAAGHGLFVGLVAVALLFGGIILLIHYTATAFLRQATGLRAGPAHRRNHEYRGMASMSPRPGASGTEAHHWKASGQVPG
jgi:hypothetical protein